MTTTMIQFSSGVAELLEYANSQNVSVDIGDCRTACGVCHKVIAALKAHDRKHL